MEALPALLLIILFLAGIGLGLWALLDALRTPDDRPFRTGTKLLWVLVIMLAHPVGALIYLFIGRPDKTQPS